jgi:cytochrome c5
MHKKVKFFRNGATVLVALVGCVATAMGADRTGREVVETVCAACHAEGKDGAPKIGDLSVWTLRAQGGLAKLANSAIGGTGKMPAHGGQPNLTDLELSRAIAYMSTGGRAADPSKAYATPAKENAEQLVANHCIRCHGPGLEGAPRVDQFADWRPRLQKGIEGLVQSAITGHKAMPARSGMAALSDSDLRNAATYMVIQSATYKVP